MDDGANFSKRRLLALHKLSSTEPFFLGLLSSSFPWSNHNGGLHSSSNDVTASSRMAMVEPSRMTPSRDSRDGARDYEGLASPTGGLQPNPMRYLVSSGVLFECHQPPLGPWNTKRWKDKFFFLADRPCWPPEPYLNDSFTNLDLHSYLPRTLRRPRAT
ncbi:hypothetical protein Nepgr_031707 [Nepenthes gracilis]|uniref:Uncharacterized protein n=1 Tax=Nepenthes gracilis TaxID=150966 RepID=A0AAD3Y7B6_NEPGR|nr:hypothetical protein Nepgr_031707 [Nepenthes gracilis]